MAIKKKTKKKLRKPVYDGTNYEEVSSASSPELERPGTEEDTTRESSGAVSDEEDGAKDSDEMKEEDFIALAMDRWRQSADYEAPTRALMIDDVKFSTGEQWPVDIKSQRSIDGRPCLTMDQLDQSIKMVTNEQRQQRPAIQINPQGSGSSRDTAEILGGLTRHVEIYSDAEIAYDTGFDSMVRGGRGWVGVATEYLPGTFDKELRIFRVKNPFTVYDDPNCNEADGSDARFRFRIADIPWSQFKENYKNAKMASLVDFSSIGDKPSEWATKETIRVADYYYVTEKTRTIALLSDGTIKNASQVTDEEKGKVIKTREDTERVVKIAKITALEKLEETEWVGSIIPLIPVNGTDLDVDGKRYLAGMVRNAKDPQRMYNYHCSSATEAVALAPKAPFIGAIGQFASQEEKWKQANVRNFAYLEYDSVDVEGKPAPPPQRNSVEPPIQALMLMIRQAGNDIKASIGIYDASLGQPGPEQSGKAILARQKQGDVATLNYSDNLARTIRVVGRVLLEAFPKVYDVPRIKRIVNADGSTKHVGIYNSQNGGYSPSEALDFVKKLEGGDAINKVFDIGVGRYDVSVSVGPNFQSKRQEAVASITALISSYPQLMEIAGDLLIGNMDWPYASEIAKRLKKSLPANLQDNEDDTPESKIAQLSSQVQNFSQQNAVLTQALNQATEIVKTKRLELESKERIALFQAQAQIVIGELKANSAAAMEQMKAMMGAIQSRLDVIHTSVGIDVEDGEAGSAAGGGGTSGDQPSGGGAAPSAAAPPPTGAPSIPDVMQA